ncbi:MAG: restriction endonuclease subunit S [Candidatus Saccharimonadales bacterium]
MTQTVLLGDICDVKIGRTPPRKESQWFSSVTGKKWVSIKDMGSSGKNIFATSEYLTDEALQKFRVPIINQGTLLLSFKLTVGRLGFAYEDMCSNEAIAQLPVNDPTIVDKDWLYYYLRNFNFDSLSSTSSIATAVNSQTVKNIKIELPHLETQKKIADILGGIDEKIELNRQMNQTLEQMGQALFRHYFVDNPEAEEWEQRTIGELCNVKIGRTPPRKQSEWFSKQGGETWISIKDMGQSATFISNSSEYLTEEAATKFNVPIIEPNTLLLSFKLTVGRLCISTKNMYSNEAIAQLPIRDSSISIEYLYYFLRSFNFQSLSSTSSIATAVNSNTVKNIKVTVPNEIAMSDFTAQTQRVLEQIKNNAQQIQTLTTLRNTLLPRLISGKMTV